MRPKFQIGIARFAFDVALTLNVQNFTFGQDENNSIKDLNKEIQSKKDEIQQIQDKQEKYTRALRKAQSSKVSLVYKKNGSGKITVFFNDLEEYERIYNLITKE